MMGSVIVVKMAVDQICNLNNEIFFRFLFRIRRHLTRSKNSSKEELTKLQRSDDPSFIR